MARDKQYVFSARTTEEGLKTLGEVKAKLNIGWDEMVIDAVSAHYGLDKAVMTLSKKEKPAKEAESNKQQPAEERPTERKRPVKKQRSKGSKKTNVAENSLITGKP